jgi:hypothetical protein
VALARQRASKSTRTWLKYESGTLDVDLFERQPRAIRDGIEREADALGRFLGLHCRVRIT